jgi:D-amino-acid dehydrogenase
MHVAVIGGGAIGTTIAYFLSRRGARVTLLDVDELGHGASFGNAGLLVPSYSTPLASYANAIEGARSLFGLPSAVNVKLMPDLGSIAWLGRMLSSARRRPSALGLATLAAMTRHSLALYDELLADAPAGMAYVRCGTMYVSRSDASLQADARLAARLGTVGIASEVLSSAQARVREPALSRSIAGAVWYPDDARLQPLNFVRLMGARAMTEGAIVHRGRVSRITCEKGRATAVITAGGRIAADRVVLAAGSWSPGLAATIGLRVPIMPAKGYSVDFTLADPPRTSMLFSERHVSVTPMNDVVRATTGLDFHGLDRTVVPARLDLIRSAYREFLDAPLILHESAAWAGFRPLTPDGLPIVGPSSRIDDLVFATGHGALGITLAPATAELVANSILNESTAIAPEISPRRFGI